MKTDDFIGGLVADQGTRPLSARKALFYTLPLALMAAVCLFSVILGLRQDFSEALTSWRYLLKVAVAASIAFFGVLLLFRMAHPQHTPRRDIKLALLALLPLGLGLAAEMIALPPGQWFANAVGFRPLYCLGLVPLLALAPLGAMLMALRHGAPRSPAAAGAVAGFAAGGLGALIYALHCNNDSPMYVAIWYLLAVGIVTLAGTAIGRLWLRW